MLVNSWRRITSELKSISYDVKHKKDFLAQLPKLRQLKNCQKGNRCFILGNGPSLKSQDFLLLKDEFTFVTNHFIHHEQLWDFNPTYYCASDANFFLPKINQEWQSKFASLPESTKLFFSYRASKKIVESVPLSQFDSYLLRYHPKKIWEYSKFQSNIENFLYSGDTVIIDFCIPLAIYMGFTDIYLMGVDCNYNINNSGTIDYAFSSKDVTTRRSSDQHLQGQWLNNVFSSYQTVKNAKLVNIYDATEGGNLNVFPKVKFENIIESIL